MLCSIHGLKVICIEELQLSVHALHTAIEMLPQPALVWVWATLAITRDSLQFYNSYSTAASWYAIAYSVDGQLQVQHLRVTSLY